MSRELKFYSALGKTLAYTATEGTEAALVVGRLYKIVATTACFVRFGSTAVTAADNGFDFGLAAEDSVTVRATSATIRAIRAAADGSLIISPIDEGV